MNEMERNVRKHLRMQGYDYSSAGSYFVTICAHGGRAAFGSISTTEAQLNDVGRIVEKWWNKLAAKFAAVELDASVIMPNHVHGIIFIADGESPKNRDESGTNKQSSRKDSRQNTVGADPCVRPSLSKILQWFKTMTTNEYLRHCKKSGLNVPGRKLWQRGFYEHVIRSDEALDRIREYIINNPANWDHDGENPLHKDAAMGEMLKPPFLSVKEKGGHMGPPLQRG